MKKWKTKQHSIGEKSAVALAKTGWWKSKTAREIVEFQLFTEELCMDFSDFHKAVEEALGRPVWTHEFALNFDGIVAEFLGEKASPTLADVIKMIPEQKRILIIQGMKGT